MCLSHLIYTVRPCLIHTCHAASMPCSDHAVLLKTMAQHGRRVTAVLCRGLEKNGMVGAWHGRGMASVNQTRPHCINQMGKTHSKPLAARHGKGKAWARHAMCESAWSLQCNCMLVIQAVTLVGTVTLIFVILSIPRWLCPWSPRQDRPTHFGRRRRSSAIDGGRRFWQSLWVVLLYCFCATA